MKVNAPEPVIRACLLGNNEAFEPYTSNIYCRRVLSGEFFVVNPHLLRDLVERGLWNEQIRQQLIAHNGSVQHISEIPEDLKEIYKTVWEMKQRNIVDMAADRSPYIDQSQSLNIHMVNPTFAKLSSMHFHAWKAGLKTGMYYLRTQAAADAIKFTIDQQVAVEAKMKRQEAANKLNVPRSVENCKMDESEVSTATLESTASSEAPIVCKLRPKGLGDNEPCMMCSG